MTLAELYNLKPEINPIYGLQIWYNNLILKDMNHIDEVDIGKMVRQNILVEVAIEKSLDFLEKDHLSGGTYVGETMESLYKSKEKIRNPQYLKKLLVILDGITDKEINEWDWDSLESKEEYRFWVSELRKMVN